MASIHLSAYRRLSACLFSLLVVLVAGCSDSTKPKEVESITPQLDTANKVTEAIGPAGGSLITTDANGLLYTLDFPPDVLPDGTEVSMTPVVDVPDLHFAKALHAGVQFEPDGLLMVEPAILTIEAPAGVDAENLLAFGWQGGGETVHLRPIFGFGDKLYLPITHFSGAGVGEGDAQKAYEQIISENDRAGDYASKLAVIEQDVLQDICGNTDVGICTMENTEGAGDYLQKMAERSLPLLAEWLDDISPDAGDDPNDIDPAELAKEYYAWLHAAISSMCGIGELRCQAFDDEFLVFSETLRGQIGQAFFNKLQLANDACDDFRVHEITDFLTFTDNDSAWGIAYVFREILGLDESTGIVSIVEEYRYRFACHLAIDVLGFPASLVKGGDYVNFDVHIRNTASTVGDIPIEGVGVTFTTDKNSCGSIDGVINGFERKVTDANGSVTLVGVAAEDTCPPAMEKVSIEVIVDENTAVADVDQFFLGKRIQLEALIEDECASAVPKPTGKVFAQARAAAPDTCEAPGRIVYSSTRTGASQIYSINSDGSDDQRLTDNAERDVSPSWSPDGTKIVFTRLSASGGDDEIIVMDADGTNEQQITNNSVHDTSASFSPDGSQIVFLVQVQATGRYEIFVMNADGSNRRQLTSDGDIEVRAPDWSPDGSKIAYNCSNQTTNGFRNICVMNADSSNPVSLMDDLEPDYDPAWSPDGTRIAFQRNQQVWVMNADGSNRHLIAQAFVTFNQPDWSPDGTRIVYASRTDFSVANSQLYIVDADGGNLKVITNSGGFDQSPSWGP